jgi:hypothetical protein
MTINQALSNEYLIVGPLTNGLTQEELDAYEFPIYEAQRVYKLSDINIADYLLGKVGTKLSILAGSTVEVGKKYSVNSDDLFTVNDEDYSGHTPILTVLSVENETIQNELVTTSIAIAAAKAGWKILKKTGINTTEPLEFACTVMYDAAETNNLIVDNSDSLHPNVDYVFNSPNSPTFRVTSKGPIDQTLTLVEFDNEFDLTDSQAKLYELEVGDFEDRDSILIHALNQGTWGDDISIGTALSKDYDNAFKIIVYYKGVQVETWEVTLVHQLDGYQRQMFAEERINGKSAYIGVKVNPANVDANDVPKLPLPTNYSLWVRNPTDLFIASPTYKLAESLIKGHQEVLLNSAPTNVLLGTRLKFQVNRNTVSKEYKVISKTSNSLKLDRPIEEDLIPVQYTNASGALVDSYVLIFDPNYTDESRNIYDGVEYYDIQRLDRVFYNYKNGSSFTINGVLGTLISAGVNKLAGGSLGSPVTIGDMIQASNKLKNPETHPIRMVLDGGVTVPAYAQALKGVVDAQGLCHGFLSTSIDSEESHDYMTEIVGYKNSLNLNTESMSLFAGWIKVFDEYNQTFVWVSPEGFAAAAQSFTTRNYNLWTPAAGWERGRVTGLDVKVKFTEGERDILVDNRINPIRYKEGSGLVIWGNETLLSKPSPLQLRSVSMLIIAIKEGLTSVLDWKNFDLNNERTWDVAEGSINGFMRDEIQAKEGVYDFSLAIGEVITDQDIDNRKMPVYLGIQPTMDIQEIPIVIGIYNKSIEISTAPL